MLNGQQPNPTLATVFWSPAYINMLRAQEAWDAEVWRSQGHFVVPGPPRLTLLPPVVSFPKDYLHAR
jgi:hypothetical protein